MKTGLITEFNTCIQAYEQATNSHNFTQVSQLVDEQAVYWFSEGSFVGIDAIKKAFEHLSSKP